jgi:hypothetical protein
MYRNDTTPYRGGLSIIQRHGGENNMLLLGNEEESSERGWGGTVIRCTVVI